MAANTAWRGNVKLDDRGVISAVVLSHNARLIVLPDGANLLRAD
jgi:hypothetical protein